VLTEQTSFVRAIPALAVSDVPRAVAFFADVLGFDDILAQADYGIAREFTILDPDRNAVTFFEAP
jgi:catechol 2,3-dioxygenase-like lactoylglutathione lyase family enzyme